MAKLSQIQCLQVAFSAAEMHLGISRGSIDLAKIASGQEDHKLKTYLQHFRMICEHEAKRKLRTSLLGAEQSSSLNMRHSTLPRGTTTIGATSAMTHRVSDGARPKRSTSDAFLNLTAGTEYGMNGKNSVRHTLSTEHLNGGTRTRQSLDSNGLKPELYRTTQSYARPPQGGSASLPRSSTTVERSYSSDIPLPVTIYRTSSRSSIHSTSSRSSLDRATDDHNFPLTHLANLSPSMLPSHNTLTPHDFETDGLEASGSAILSTPLENTVNELDNRLKELSQSINEEKSKLEESVLLASELIHAVNKALQFLYILVKKERKERENLEKRHDKLFKKANFITQHYDGCLVDLAKEVSLIAYNDITIAYNDIIIMIKLDEVMHTL